MFNSIFGLFEFTFAIGYFIPSLVFLIAGLVLLNVSGAAPSLVEIAVQSKDYNFVSFATFIVFSAWILGVVLLAVNRQLIRLLEGYPVERFEFLKRLQVKKYRALKSKVEKSYDSGGSPSAIDLEALASRYPDDENYVLPTSFGNIVRSFEVYSRVMYGFEVISGWDRLVFLIPPEERKIIDKSKAILDFWVNLFFLSILLTLIYFLVSTSLLDCYVSECVSGFLLYFASRLSLALSILLVLLTLAYRGASSAAIQWGNLIKGAVDVYLPVLQAKLGFTTPFSSRRNEKEFWNAISQSITFRTDYTMPEYRRSSTDESALTNPDT